MRRSITSKLFRSLLVAIAFLASTAAASAQGGGKAEPNRINVSENVTTVRGSLANGEEMEYVFAAKTGSVVTIKNSRPSAFDFRVFSEEADVETEFESSPTLTLTLPQDGDYYFFVRKKAGGPHRATFHLTLKISVSRPLSSTSATSATSEAGLGCAPFQLERKRNNMFNLIRLLRDEQVVSVIKLPTGISVNGFALNYLKKTANGFLFSVEYGSRFYYEKQFHFSCEGGSFFLTKIVINSHDQSDPEDTSKQKIVRIDPNVSLLEFSIESYMTEL